MLHEIQFCEVELDSMQFISITPCAHAVLKSHECVCNIGDPSWRMQRYSLYYSM
jgi:hypothetical protein